MNQYDRYVPKRFKRGIVYHGDRVGMTGWWWSPVRGKDQWFPFGPYVTADAAIRGAKRRGIRASVEPR